MTKPTHDPTEMLRLGSFPTRGCAPSTFLHSFAPTPMCATLKPFNSVMFPTLGPPTFWAGAVWLHLGNLLGVLAYVSLKPSKALGSQAQRAEALRKDFPPVASVSTLPWD